jgi:hypothetical protein
MVYGDIMITTTNDLERSYQITALSKDDIRCLYDDLESKKPERFRQIMELIDSMDDIEMRDLACDMASDYLEQLFWSSLRILFEQNFLDNIDELVD